MKKLLSVLLSFVLCISMITPAIAQQEISIIVNGAEIEFDVSPFIENGRTMVPLRAICEAMGAKVSWNDEARCATVSKDAHTRTFYIDEGTIFDGLSSVRYPCDVAPKIVNDRTFVPLRAIAQSVDCNVGWDEKTRTVTVDEKEQPIDFTYETQTVTLDTKDEYARITVNYTYPKVTGGNEFISSDNVSQLNSLIDKQKNDILDIQKYADDFADDWQVIIQEKIYNYPDIVLNITTKLFISEKYGTVSVITEYDAPWTGANMVSATYDKDTFEKMELAQVFDEKEPEQLYTEIYGEFVKMDEYSRYGKEYFVTKPDWVSFVVSDDDLYVYMSSVILTGVGRYNRFYTAVREY